MGALGMSRMSSLESHLLDIAGDNNISAEHARTLLEVVDDQALAVTNLVLKSDEKDMQTELKRLRDDEQQYKITEQKLAELFNTQSGTRLEEKAAFQAIKDSQTQTKPLMDQAVELGMTNKMDQGTRFLDENFRPALKEWRKRIRALVEFESKMNNQAFAEAKAVYLSSRNLLIASLIAAIVISFIVATWISRSIVDPLEEATLIAQKVAAGDLTSQTRSNYRDEIGQLIRALQVMNDNLAGIVGKVRSGTDTITLASAEIASGNLDLASRTERQASSLEETASSMEDLTSTVKQNADNASQANKLAQTASEVAMKGGSVVSQVVETMEAINESSRRIVDIISVIDGIAFQTNILALNAAVEAARAGEQGRGFAVVASEVRNLAQRSAAAAKEIKELIGDSVEKVDVGCKLVNQAGSTMSEVVESIRHVTNIVSEISSASYEQSQGIDQVNQAIIEMDTVTQQNAALVEQATVAADSMQDQAANLLRVVDVFKINNNHININNKEIADTGSVGRTSRNSTSAPPAKSPLSGSVRFDIAKFSAPKMGGRPDTKAKSSEKAGAVSQEWGAF